MYDFNRRNITMEFSRELAYLNETVAQQEMTIDELMLKSAMYKAYFFGKFELANKLSKQIKENIDSCIDGWDSFWREETVYRTLDDMCRNGLITEEERRFCEV